MRLSCTTPRTTAWPNWCAHTAVGIALCVRVLTSLLLLPPQCEVPELKRALPTRNNPAGLERGYYTKPVPADLPGGACPAGGCPPNWISSDDPKLVGFDRDFIDLGACPR